MDMNPGREAQMMARWTLAGSLGDLLGPLFLAVAYALSLGWRSAYALTGLGMFSLVAALAVRRLGGSECVGKPGAAALMRNTAQTLQRPGVPRTIGLLRLSDLMLDVFLGYAALYLADVMSATPLQVSLMMSAMMLAGLVSDALVVRLLESIPGATLVRRSAAAVLVLYPALLVAPWLALKLILLPVLRLTTLGWYQVLQGGLYAAARGRSGMVMAIASPGSMADGLLAWGVGWAAGLMGLLAAMWLLLLGALGLLLFVPGARRGVE
jgi:FSR family fosmidomycin resistance protein-like MFS transporter